MRSNSQNKNNSEYKKLSNDLGFGLGNQWKNIKLNSKVNSNVISKENTHIKINSISNNKGGGLITNKNKNISNNNFKKAEENIKNINIVPIKLAVKPVIMKAQNNININPQFNSKLQNAQKVKQNLNPNINTLSNKNSYAENFHPKAHVDKPSDKYTKIKSSDPFDANKKHKTNFGYVYSAGGIPCRIQHGSIRLKLKWDIEPESNFLIIIVDLEFDPILLVCFEGLLETEHPYNFAASQCIKEMLQSRGAFEKVNPILSKIINPLRAAFSSNNANVFQDTLDITRMLSELVKENLNPYLHFFLQQINKRAFEIKYKEKVFDLLRILESNGGEDALKEIKKKIPTYVSLI